MSRKIRHVCFQPEGEPVPPVAVDIDRPDGALPVLGRPNLFLTVELPPDFAERSWAVGYTPENLLWALAQDFCARAPKSIRIVTAARARRRRLPVGVIPFPEAFDRGE